MAAGTMRSCRNNGIDFFTAGEPWNASNAYRSISAGNFLLAFLGQDRFIGIAGSTKGDRLRPLIGNY